MKLTVVVSLKTMSPSEVIESLERTSAGTRVSSYSIVNSVGYFVVEVIKDDNAGEGYESDVYESECSMCGKERCMNTDGYCSQCWQVWNS